MKEMRKIFLLSLFVTVLSVGSSASNAVKFYINEGVSSASLKESMEKNISDLLSSINAAQSQGNAISYTGIGISPEATQQIDMLWMNVHFLCEETELVERCLTTSNGFQVRNIPLSLTPLAGEKIEEPYQEAVVNFDKQGKIVSFYFTISMNMYSKVMQNKTEISDIRRRMEILDYVEHFRTAYNMKDMPFLQQVFSDDALIITGSVIKVKKSEVMPSDRVVRYSVKTKREYLTNLANAFRNNQYINVAFDDITIVHHPTKRDVYGVTVRQRWNSSRYSDEGYVFMVWDFTDEKQPKIHVRTWQPEYLDKASGRKLPQNEVFTMKDFDLE